MLQLKVIQEVVLDLEVVLVICDIILRERGSLKSTLAVEWRDKCMLSEVGNIRPKGHIGPSKSIGLILPRHRGELIKSLTKYSRLVFNLIILYGQWVMLKISKWPWADKRFPTPADRSLWLLTGGWNGRGPGGRLVSWLWQYSRRRMTRAWTWVWEKRMQSHNMNKVESAHLGNWLDNERDKSRITLNFPTKAIGGIMGYSSRWDLLSAQDMSSKV